MATDWRFPELLTAERELGRLLQQQADAPAELVDALATGALLREVQATFQLDSVKIHLEDIAAARVDLRLLPGAKHELAGEALRLLRAGETLLRGLTSFDNASDTVEPATDDDEIGDLRGLIGPDDDGDADDDDGGRLDPLDIEDAVASARSATADLEAFLAGGLAAGRRPVPLVPLSSAWMTKAWSVAFGTPDDREAEALARAVVDIDSGLSRPGLAGVAMALRTLHADGYWPQEDPRLAPEQFRERLTAEAAAKVDESMAERVRAGPGRKFTRLIGPWLVARACDLPTPGPWLSDGFQRRTGYARAAEMYEGEWERYCCAAMANGFAEERGRLPKMLAAIERWRRGLARDEKPGRGRGRRPGRGGPLAMLPLLAEQPVVTPEWAARRLGVTVRATQMTLAELTRLGVVREEIERHTHKIYEAVS